MTGATSSGRHAFREALQSSKHIIVVAGAGLSAVSGIPTFRDGGGMWRSLKPTDLATPQAFQENPSLVWQFYHYRRAKALEAKPNPAHEIIAKMSVPQYLKKVAPDAQSFHLITQNVDTLSTDALCVVLNGRPRAPERGDSDPTDTAGGTPAAKPTVYKDPIFEMHGRILDVQCTSGSCAHCAEDHLDAINSVVYKADMCLVVGTSSQVHIWSSHVLVVRLRVAFHVRPASTCANRVRRHGGKVAVFNLEPSERDFERANFVFRGPCEALLPETLPELV
ncbi:DHS-like NAD/FAD-binding domain-containing protein [Trametes elegans]|nr:DHS-like NAD/FAD-binding domain-containing protein [Trametes elegans]